MATRAQVRHKGRWARLSLLALGLGAGAWWIGSRVFPDPVSRGVAAYKRGDWSEAVNQARERLLSSKDDPKALRLMARSAARVGRHPTAREFYARLSARDLEAEDYYLLGLGGSLTGEYLAAQEDLKQALALDPDHAESLYLLALVWYQKAQPSSALGAAIRLSRQPGWQARGDLVQGMSLAQDSDPRGAADKLQQALERDPTLRTLPSDPFSTHKLLARCLLQSGRPVEAKKTLSAILESGPDLEASWLLSRAFLQEGKKTEAVAALGAAENYRALHGLEPEPAPYVGEARCALCHRDIQQELLASRHATTYLRGPALAELKLPDHPLTEPDNPRVSHALKRVDGEIQFETRVEDKLMRAVVLYALGSSDRYTSFVGRDEAGRSAHPANVVVPRIKRVGMGPHQESAGASGAVGRVLGRDVRVGRRGSRVLDLSHDECPCCAGGHRPRGRRSRNRL